MAMTHALINFSLSPHLGVWGVPLGLRGKGMVSSGCIACRVSVGACNVCVGACTCTCTCGCKCKCDNVHSYGYMYMYM